VWEKAFERILIIPSIPLTFNPLPLGREKEWGKKYFLSNNEN